MWEQLEVRKKFAGRGIDNPPFSHTPRVVPIVAIIHDRPELEHLMLCCLLLRHVRMDTQAMVHQGLTKMVEDPIKYSSSVKYGLYTVSIEYHM